MQVENSFSVDVAVDRVWEYLLDIQAVAPCVPGAELTEVVSDTEFKGTVTVKLGAVKVSYKGTVELTMVDQSARRVVLNATGSETRGAGGASGTVTSTVTSDGPERTTVHIISEINITGRVAQFGRNIIQDVSSKLIQDFARCLETNLKSREAPAESAGDARGTVAAPLPDLPAPAAVTTNPVKRTDTQSEPPSPSASPPTPVIGSAPQTAEIKILPIIVGVTRSRLAKGFRRLAKVLAPSEDEGQG